MKKFAFYPQGGNFFGDLFPNNFVDVMPGTGILAYNGSDYTYEQHNGCDTDISGFTAQAIGVPIFAALDGTVAVAHDGEFDMNTASSSAQANYVILDHGNGQQTVYYHMKKGSVAVTVGQQVKAGEQIGLTGSSGNSTAPHLHFQAQVNGNLYEPFSGTSRPGDSGWANQPVFRTDLYLRELVLTNQDLGTWQGLPYDTTRTGTFAPGVQRVGMWMRLGNAASVTSLTGRYVRPDGSVAFTTTRFAISNAARNSYFDFYYNINLDVSGMWKLQLLINDQVFTEAPFEVSSAPSFPNRAPGAVQIAFDPATPVPSDVLFCRVTSPVIYLDPDYDFVRYHYVWKVNGTVVRDIVSAGQADAIPRDTAGEGDIITCSVTTSDGKADGPTTQITTAPAQLQNIATRIRVLPDPNQLIGGFIIHGSEPKTVVIRATGPSLSSFFSGVLADPTLELFQGSTMLASNDNWKDTDRAAIESTQLAPKNDLESAIVKTLEPGAYTAIVRDKSSRPGIGLVEVYDVSKNAGSQLANIASRGFVDEDDNVMIGGFIIAGNDGANGKVVVRAIGPSLKPFGIDNALADPTLELRDANGALLQGNDNWKDTQQAEITATNLAPSDEKESALLASLRAGSYTAIVRGKGNTTGVALVEVYNLQ